MGILIVEDDIELHVDANCFRRDHRKEDRGRSEEGL